MSELMPQARATSELCVLVACSGFLVAIPVRCVSRLVLPDDVTGLDLRMEGPCLGTLRVDGEPYAGWDLGQLLGVEPTDASWVLLRVAYGGRTVAIALRTGACLMVQPLRPETSLPGTIFRARGRAFPAAFDAAAVQGNMPTLFGVWLDPLHLLTAQELRLSDDLVAALVRRGSPS